MTDQPSIYLAGPVAAFADGGKEWRDAGRPKQWPSGLPNSNGGDSDV